MLVNLKVAAQGTNRNFLEIFFVSALGKNTEKKPAHVRLHMKSKPLARGTRLLW